MGKTELARVLAAELGISFIRFDMSEYAEKHAVAKLIGAPAGYVGYEEGGLLTEEIRKHPHAVLLLDEIECSSAGDGLCHAYGQPGKEGGFPQYYPDDDLECRGKRGGKEPDRFWKFGRKYGRTERSGETYLFPGVSQPVKQGRIL